MSETENTAVENGRGRDPELGVGVIDELPVGIYRSSFEGGITAVNDTFLEMFDADSRAELLDRPVQSLYADEDTREAFLDALSTSGTVEDFEMRMRTLSGDVLWMSTTATVVEDEEGNECLEGVVRDVTERKRVEAELEEQRRRQRQIADNASDVLWLFSPDFEELYFINKAYEDVWQRPVEELEDDPTTFLEPVVEEDRPELQAAMENLASGEEVDAEYRIELPDGSTRWLWSKGRPVRDDDGTVYRVAGFTRDVTEKTRRKLELQGYKRQLEATIRDLERSNEELEQFAYIASHDLQEPLRMVSSYVDLVAAEYGDELDEEGEEFVDFAVDGAERMRGMIDGLLRYSRVHTHGDAVEAVETDAVLDEAVRDLELQIEECDATIDRNPLPTVAADRAQLAQVFRNLLGNALSHAGQGVTIEVSATTDDGTVTFAVADDGPGIPPEEQDDVFDLFEQGYRTKEGGSGIGLAVCRRIVQRHDGSIWVESDPGDGATFYFTVPEPSAVEDDEDAFDDEFDDVSADFQEVVDR